MKNRLKYLSAEAPHIKKWFVNISFRSLRKQPILIMRDKGVTITLKIRFFHSKQMKGIMVYMVPSEMRAKD